MKLNFSKKLKSCTNIFFIVICFGNILYAQEGQPLNLALLKYQGGGDWYANPTSLRNLAIFCNNEIKMNLNTTQATVEPGDVDMFNYPFIHVTGHGNVIFSEFEAENLRKYLISGGFVHIDDNFGLDPYIRLAMKQVFPELDFIEVPFSHDIYQKPYEFNQGLPKIHEHDKKPAQGFGLFWEGRMVAFYSYESDLGDGWEDQSVHNDTDEARILALRMGANIIKYAFEN